MNLKGLLRGPWLWLWLRLRRLLNSEDRCATVRWVLGSVGTRARGLLRKSHLNEHGDLVSLRVHIHRHMQNCVTQIQHHRPLQPQQLHQQQGSRQSLQSAAARQACGATLTRALHQCEQP